MQVDDSGTFACMAVGGSGRTQSVDDEWVDDEYMYTHIHQELSFSLSLVSLGNQTPYLSSIEPVRLIERRVAPPH